MNEKRTSGETGKDCSKELRSRIKHLLKGWQISPPIEADVADIRLGPLLPIHSSDEASSGESREKERFHCPVFIEADCSDAYAVVDEDNILAVGRLEESVVIARVLQQLNELLPRLDVSLIAGTNANLSSICIKCSSGEGKSEEHHTVRIPICPEHEPASSDFLTKLRGALAHDDRDSLQQLADDPGQHFDRPIPAASFDGDGNKRNDEN